MCVYRHCMSNNTLGQSLTRMNRWFGNNSRVHRLGSKLLQVFTNNYNKNYNIHRPPSTYSYFQPLRKPTQPRSKRWPLFLLLAGATSGSSLWLGKTIFAESNMDDSSENVWNILADENNDHKDPSPSVLASRSSTSSSSPTLVLFEMEVSSKILVNIPSDNNWTCPSLVLIVRGFAWLSIIIDYLILVYR